MPARGTRIKKGCFLMPRGTGTYVTTATGDENVRAFVPRALPPADPELDPASYAEQNARAEIALSRLSAMAGHQVARLRCHPQGGLVDLPDGRHPGHVDRRAG